MLILLSGECGIVKSSWQHGNCNHFPPDVGVLEVGEGGKHLKNQLPPALFPPLYVKSTTSHSPMRPIPPYTRTHPLSKLYTSCLSLYPRRQPGQAVFTAEVIGVVWREPDPGPAKA